MKRGHLFLNVGLGTIAMLSAGLAAVAVIENRASYKILTAIRFVMPGKSIAEVRRQLGSEMYEISELESVLERGSVKDPAFCIWIRSPAGV